MKHRPIIFFTNRASFGDYNAKLQNSLNIPLYIYHNKTVWSRAQIDGFQVGIITYLFCKHPFRGQRPCHISFGFSQVLPEQLRLRRRPIGLQDTKRTSLHPRLPPLRMLVNTDSRWLVDQKVQKYRNNGIGINTLAEPEAKVLYQILLQDGIENAGGKEKLILWQSGRIIERLASREAPE